MVDERPSYFTLLGLDPEAPWDERLFRRRFSELRAEWTRESGGFASRPKTIEARRNLNFLKGITVMESEEGRRKEREKAKLSRADELTRRSIELADRLRLTLAKGYLLKPELDAFWTEYGEVLTNDPGLRGELERAEVREVEAKQPPSALDSNTASGLRANLQTAQAQSLYDALHEVDPTITTKSPLERLRAAAAKLEDKAHLTKDKSNPKIAAWDRLAGQAKRLFSTEDDRARYDLFMERETVQGVLLRFESFLQAATAISAEQVEIYLHEVRTKGVGDLDMARDRLIAHFQAKFWVIDLPSREAETRVASQTQCPFCATLNEPGSRACATCDFVLDQPCPSCGRVEPRYGGCRCGFPIGHRDRVAGYVADARGALEEHDFHQADLKLSRAETIWRLPPGNADRLAMEIQRIRATLGELRLNLDGIARQIDELLRARRFVAAERQLRQAPVGLPRREMLLAQSEKAVGDARARCREARKPGMSRGRRSELYAEALRICDDLETARAELAAIPPAPPAGVHAQVDDPAAGVLITWEPSPDPEISYVVMRGTGGSPPHSAEALPTQQRLGPVTTTSMRDRDAAGMPGAALRYAVLADRLGTYSEPVAAAPVVVTTEAKVTATSAGASEIRLTWQVPERAVGVLITRVQVGVADEPVTMTPTEPGLLLDTEVRDGGRYRYTLRVAYENPAGGLRYSCGARAEATAVRPPAPPGRLAAIGVTSEFAISLHRVQLRWPDPGAGSVRVVRQPGAGTLREGDRRLLADIAGAGHVLEGPSPALDHWIDPGMTACTYAPVLVVDGFGYVGAPRRYAMAPDVTGLTVEFSGRLVRLGWDWPPGCVGAAIGFDPATPPDDPTVAASQVIVYRNGQETPGEYSLPIGPHFRTHVRIGTVVRRDNAEFVSTGVPLLIERPRLTVHYEVRNVRRRWELVLEVTEPVQVPALVLRGRAGGPPRSRRDGEIVHRLNPMRIAGRHVVPLPRPSGAAELGYRLFTASPGDGGTVSLEHR